MMPLAFWLVAMLVIWACWTDVTALRIPNAIPAAVALIALVHAVLVQDALMLPPATILWTLAAAVLVFLFGWAMFAWGKLGGGDVKLMAAIALWFGWGVPLVRMLLVMSIAGAVVSAAVMVLRKLSPMPEGGTAVLRPDAGAPYALAVAAGFFIVAPAVP